MTASNQFQMLDQQGVAAMASGFRQELLAALAEPDSAANLARRFDMSRQRIGYHMRELEKAGCIELAGERQKRGLKERLYRVRPIAWVFAPKETGRAAAVEDAYSWASLVNLLGRGLWDLLRLRRRADAAGKRVATLAVEADVRFAGPAARRAFSEDLLRAVEQVVARHHDPRAAGGRDFRLVVGAYPRIETAAQEDSP